MSDRDRVTGLLGTSGEDAGCEGTLALLAEYVEGELAGRDIDELLPAVAAHLRGLRRSIRARPSTAPRLASQLAVSCERLRKLVEGHDEHQLLLAKPRARVDRARFRRDLSERI